ncbi:NAD-dependent epimerase/dehydratase family protein [Anaerolineales bacterium]
MRVFIAGIDGYLGWALAQFLTAKGYVVAGADGLLRRQWVEEMGSNSAIPIASYEARIKAFNDYFSTELDFRIGDLCDYDFISNFIREFQPDAIVHLGQMPSAPYSMIDVKHAVWTQQNNITSNMNLLWIIKDICPDAHLVKLGTMGEYGTPNMDIPEGFFEIEFRGKVDKLPFPRQAGSFYHQSKVFDSHNTLFANKMWEIRATDVMQGVVFGTRFPGMGLGEAFNTRLDFDQAFGTAINRFCCQAIVNHPLTLFGEGNQKRGFLPLKDSMECLELAIKNPAEIGEYRVFNQFESCYTLHELAHMVQEEARSLGIYVDIQHYENPRKELENHYYNPDRENLLDLGYEPSDDIQSEIRSMLKDLAEHKHCIEKNIDVLLPDIRWDGTKKRSQIL